jgi:hypothetical protein
MHLNFLFPKKVEDKVDQARTCGALYFVVTFSRTDFWQMVCMLRSACQQGDREIIKKTHSHPIVRDFFSVAGGRSHSGSPG